MIQSLASYTMRGQMQAVVVTVVTAILSLIIFPLGYISAAAVALVTLRIGVTKGVKVAVIAAIVSSVLTMLIMQSPWMGIAFFMLLWLPVIVLAAYLRRSMSLMGMLQRGVAMAVVIIAGFYLITDNPVLWWNQVLSEMINGMSTEMGVAANTFAGVSDELAPIMTGIVALAFLIQTIGSLLLARAWQAGLYNPGGFGEEFRQLKMGKRFALLTSLLFFVALMLKGDLGVFILSLVIVAIFPLILQGMAIVHAIVKITAAHRFWLYLLYGMLMMTLPQTAITLAAAGFIDNWFDFRAFAQGKKV